MIDLEGRKPPEGMTNPEWQKYFAQMRKQVKPSYSRYMVYPTYRGQNDEYYGDTIYQTYCKFINNILRAIRSGECDYCFFVYQVAELLKYEPRLQSKWLPDAECFQVWINSRR